MDPSLEKLDKLINSQYELTSHLRNLIDGVWGSQIDFALDEVEFKLRLTQDKLNKLKDTIDEINNHSDLIENGCRKVVALPKEDWEKLINLKKD